MSDTLVLAADYTPIDKVTWQRAISLFFMGKVEIIENHTHDLRSVTVTFKMPSVIRFLRMMRGRKKVVKFSRENVYQRDKGKCQYCLHLVPRSEITYDHVVPRALGGKTEWTNIVISCADCNQRKGHRTMSESGMRPKTMPVKPKKLPDAVSLTLTWRPGEPETWKSWLKSIEYWNTTLDE